MTIYFCKTTELNKSNYVKIPLRSSATLNIENDDKYCFLWSILAELHACKNVMLIEYQIIDNILMN